jgi:hypothetical protein
MVFVTSKIPKLISAMGILVTTSLLVVVTYCPLPKDEANKVC